jgi:CDP-diacylglycerol--glycerol-3-phosphate 3-phosphatidyltransferase
MALVGIAVITIVGLEVTHAGENAWRHTISEYGLLPNGWIFTWAALLAAVGSAAISVSLTRRRIIPIFSLDVLALAGWSVGLAVLGLFHKNDWSVGASTSGTIHFSGCVLAFLSLPIAALLIGYRSRHLPRGRVVVWLSLGSMLWIAGTAAVMGMAVWQGLPWYHAAPLGIVERGLVVTEIATLFALGALAGASARRPALAGLEISSYRLVPGTGVSPALQTAEGRLSLGHPRRDLTSMASAPEAGGTLVDRRARPAHVRSATARIAGDVAADVFRPAPARSLPGTPGVSSWNIANVLTGLRLVLVPFFVAFLFLPGDGWRATAFAAFALASFTDLLDGALARRYNLVTDFGKIADPLADKALMGGALVSLSILGQVPWWMTSAILAREIGVTVLRFAVIRRGVIPASYGGKVKTVLQVAAIGLFILPGVAEPVRWVMMGLALAVTVATGIDYVIRALWPHQARSRRVTPVPVNHFEDQRLSSDGSSSIGGHRGRAGDARQDAAKRDQLIRKPISSQAGGSEPRRKVARQVL